MALRPTGLPNRPLDLVLIETDLFDLVIKGKPYHPTVETLELHRPKQTWVDATFQAQFGRGMEAQMKLYSREHGGLIPWVEGMASEPLFFENQNYELIIEKKDDSVLGFYHVNPYLREAVTPVGSSILAGVLNFRNDVGYSEFEIRRHGRAVLTVQMEVFPSKLDYRRDYQRIMQDVNEQIYNLAFDFMRRTFHNMTLRHAGQPSLTEFFSILQAIFQQLVSTVDRMNRAPHYKMREQSHIRGAARVKKAGRRNVAFLQKRANELRPDETYGFIHIHGKRYIPQRLLESKRVTDYDTNENRFVRWMLIRIQQQLQHIRKILVQSNQPDEQLLRRFDQMSGQLKRLLKLPFLQVGELKHISISLVLQMAPGYREVYRYYLMLMKGLSLHSGLFRLSMKNIAQLYEYWCFLKIHHILRSKYELLEQNVIQVHRNGLFVTLDQSRSAKMIYHNPRNGEVFTLYYNSLPENSGKPPTVGQKPDNVLTLEKRESSIKYNYVFDAKYRLNPAEEGTWYRQHYMQPGPQEDDINTMHRYRDAIVYAEKSTNPDQPKTYERNMFGAYVLFPYADEEGYRAHPFYKSISLVNVGAFPFLPESTTLVEQFLDEIITDSPEKAYERSIQPRGTKEYYEIRLTGKNVIIGALRTKEQLEVALKHRFYHMPLKNITDHSVLTQLEYAAIYQSKGKFGEEDAGIRWYGRIKQWNVIMRQDITEIPARSWNRNKLYVRFEIEDWIQKAEPIRPNGFWVYRVWFATYYMFERAHELAELRLESESELQTWRELRRKGVVHVELDHEYIDLARRVTGMRVEGE